MAAKYSIGIDLGTSTSALAYRPNGDSSVASAVLEIPQRESETSSRDFPLLPSYLYLLPPGEADAAPLGANFEFLAKGPFEVGEWARQRARDVPGRVVRSAKSWLSHAGVDREENFLPWGTGEIATKQRWSPVECSAAYLAYLKAAWDEKMGAAAPEDRFDAQDITITVPASFDEIAQRLTRQAARLAGYPERIKLLEEPQAAFYHWLEERHAGDVTAETLRRILPDLAERPQNVLVCDIGGGTTDFSLFEISPRSPAIQRIAVSDHILLGGDNIDLALAHRLESRLAADGKKLSARQWGYLVNASRHLKERAFGENPPAELSTSIPSEGSSLLGKTLSVTIPTEEIFSLVLEGFFPEVGADERPRRAHRGLKEIGLPFAEDSAITRHLAEFLDGRPVDAVLFNGGTLIPARLGERLLAQISRWQGRAPAVLTNPSLELAVARGAAYYGVASGERTRIRADYPHSVFFEISRASGDARTELVCVLPKGTETGKKVRLDRPKFDLLVNQPVRFQAYYSNARKKFSAGEIVPLDSQRFYPLPPLQTELRVAARTDNAVQVQIEASIAETGLLQLACVPAVAEGSALADVAWNLDFALRPAAVAAESEISGDETTDVSAERIKSAQEKISLFYGHRKVKADDIKDSVKSLKRDLEKILGPRDAWTLPLLRALWPALEAGIGTRRRSAAHETTWLLLAGTCLRPGYGADLDPWRISELWKCFVPGMAFPKEKSVTTQWWIMWRRVSAGLDADQQTKLTEKVLPFLRTRSLTPEMLLLLGSLERISVDEKIKIGTTLLKQALDGKGSDAHLWALGRLSARSPLYAGAQSAIPAAEAAKWVEALLASGGRLKNLSFFLTHAARRVGDRSLDLPDELRARVVDKMRELEVNEEAIRAVQEHVAVNRLEQARSFGEDIPAGLRVAS